LKLNMTLDPNAVMTPIQRSARECTENIMFGLKSIEAITSLPEELVEEDVFFQVRQGYPTDFDTQKRNYKEWLLKKGFNDLMEGIKYSVAEASYYISICNLAPEGHVKTSIKEIREFLRKKRRESLKMHLPESLREVNKYLSGPLVFENDILSLNQIRNCLVHRSGVVTDIDIKEHGDDSLIAQWRRVKLFYKVDEEEIELTKGHEVKVENAQVLYKLEKREKRFPVGSNVIFDYLDFNELIMTCYHFGYDLVNKLPKLPPVTEG
jgi:hypothetical protein